MLIYVPDFTLTKFFDGNKVTYFLTILICITLLSEGIRVLNEKIKSTHKSKLQGKSGFDASLTGY